MYRFFAPLPTHPPLYFAKLAGGFLFVIAILAALQCAPKRSRKYIIAGFTFLGGLYYFLEFFWPTHKAGPMTGENFLTPYLGFVANVSTVIQTFAIGLGIISLMQYHLRRISRQREGWGNSVALVISFVAMTVFGLLNQYSPHLPIFGKSITSQDIFNFLFNGGYSNMDAAMFSIIAFYIASASYRAFRIRSLESSLLMISALIVMLGSVTFGTALTNWIPVHTSTGTPDFWANLRVERISNWLLTQINSAAQRGILFGLTVGGLAVSLRYWLSLERGTYFDKEL